MADLHSMQTQVFQARNTRRQGTLALTYAANPTVTEFRRMFAFPITFTKEYVPTGVRVASIAIPKPTTLDLAGLGLLGVACVRRKLL